MEHRVQGATYRCWPVGSAFRGVEGQGLVCVCVWGGAVVLPGVSVDSRPSLCISLILNCMTNINTKNSNLFLLLLFPSGIEIHDFLLKDWEEGQQMDWKLID